MMPAISCKKEIEKPVEEGPSIEVVVCGEKEMSDEASTKTYAEQETVDGKLVTHMWWSSTDKIKLYEIVDGTVANTANSDPAGDEAKETASFKTKISGTATGSSFKYTAVYPSDCIEKSGEKYIVKIPNNQTLGGPDGNNVAANADVLVGMPIDHGTTRIADGEVLSYKFKRFGTLVKMTVKGLTAGETVENIEVSADVPLTGNRNVSLTTGEIAGTNTTSYKNIKLALNCKVPDSGDGTGNLDVWFRVLPGTWTATSSTPISVKVQTYAKTYTKKIVPTASKPEIKLSFLNAGFTSFGVTGFDAAVNHVVPDGEYVICVKRTDGTYKALSRIASTTRLASADVALDAENTDEGKVLAYKGNEYDIVWVLDTDEETGITIHTPYGEYLKNTSTTSAAGAALDSKSPQYYAIREVEKDADGVSVYSIISKPNTAYTLRYYSSGTNNFYAFYSSANTSTNAKLYLVPATDVDKTPTIILSEASATVHSNADSYEFTVKKRFVKGNILAEIFEDEDGMVENVSVVNGDNVKMSLHPNTGSKKRTACVRVYSDSDKEKNAEDLFELTQEAGSSWSDIISSDMVKINGSGYRPIETIVNTPDNTIQSNAAYDGLAIKSTETATKGAIQFNISKNSNCGIWTTKSGGVISQVSVDFAEESTYTIDVYGRNGYAFANNTTEESDKHLGTLSASKTTISDIVKNKGEYEYLLLKPTYEGKVIRVNKFTIVWKEPKPQRTGLAFYIGEDKVTETLEATVGSPFAAPVLKDENGEISAAAYESSDPEVVAVDSDGKVTIKKKGTATITATVPEDDTYSEAKIAYTIEVRNVLESISLNTDNVTKEFTLTGTFDYDGLVVTANYNDKTMADVTDKAIVTPPSMTEGPQTVKVSYTENGVTASATYEVLIEDREIAVIGVTLDNTAAQLQPGGQLQLKATVLPANATNKDVEWTTSNPAVATVSENGLVNAVGAGKATITVISKADASKTASCEISVASIGVLSVNFEKAISAYTRWDFTNVASQATHANVEAHGGSYFGTTSGKASASITTKVKVAPKSITFYVSKQTTNTTSSYWKIQTSENGTSWTDVVTDSATDMSAGTWKEINYSFTSAAEVYVRVAYSGSTAVRTIDDLSLEVYGEGDPEPSELERLDAPVGLVCSEHTSSSLTFTWNEVNNATGYYVSLDNGASWKDNGKSTTYTWSGLAPETTYTIYVKAKGDDESYTDSDSVTASGTTDVQQGGGKMYVKYTVSSTTAVTTSGDAPAGSSATFKNTYSTKDQITSGNTMTLTLKGFAGKNITGIMLSMHSNSSKGSGSFSAKSGSTEFASLSATTFNKFYDNDSYGTSYRDVNVSLISTPTVGSDEDVVIVIGATVNSLYCQSFEIEYE